VLKCKELGEELKGSQTWRRRTERRRHMVNNKFLFCFGKKIIYFIKKYSKMGRRKIYETKRCTMDVYRFFFYDSSFFRYFLQHYDFSGTTDLTIPYISAIFAKTWQPSSHLRVLVD
jgi:hypothetical protein